MRSARQQRAVSANGTNDALVYRTAVLQLQRRYQRSPQLSEETASDRGLLLCNFLPGVHPEESSKRRRTHLNHLFFKYIHTVCNFSAWKIAGNTTSLWEWKICAAFEARGYKNLIVGESHSAGKSFFINTVLLNASYSLGPWHDMISHVLLCKLSLKFMVASMLWWFLWGNNPLL